MDEPVRYGVIGCAGVGNRHAESVRAAERVELVACADVDPEAAMNFAEEHGVAETYEDAAAMIEGSDVDAVSVCTPSGTHADVVVEAAEAGAHVLCEKPLDVYADRMDRAVEACDAAGVTLAGVFQKRFDPANRRAKGAMEDGELGKPVLGDTTQKWFRSQPYYDQADWRGTRDMDGGALMNQAIHKIDLLAWLMGGVESVRAITANVDRDLECEDTAAIALEFENGAVGTIEGTTAVKGGDSKTELNGTEGSLTIGNAGITHFEVGTGEESHYGAETESREGAGSESEFGENHEAVVADFVGALLADREPAVTGREARHAVDIILAAYAADADGESVDVADVREGRIDHPEVREDG
ncbi:MAG: Gfo/Idh/MocA family protein [Halobacteriales archaeon]